MTLAFLGSLSPMVVAQEIETIETTLTDPDLTEIQNNICYVAIPTISDETAMGNPLVSNDLGQYTYTKTETYYVSTDDDYDEGFYDTRTVTITVDAVEVDSTIQDNLSNPSAQEEVTNICL